MAHKKFKNEKLYNLFQNKNKIDIKTILEKTEIKNEHSLRTTLYHMRKLELIDLSVKWGFVIKKDRKKELTKKQ